jgi:hypothetical protein
MSDYQQDGPTYAQGREKPKRYDPPMGLWSHQLGHLTVVRRFKGCWLAYCTCHPNMVVYGYTREVALTRLRDMAEVGE